MARASACAVLVFLCRRKSAQTEVCATRGELARIEFLDQSLAIHSVLFAILALEDCPLWVVAAAIEGRRRYPPNLRLMLP